MPSLGSRSCIYTTFIETRSNSSGPSRTKFCRSYKLPDKRVGTLQISSFPICSSRLSTRRGEVWAMSRFNVYTACLHDSGRHSQVSIHPPASDNTHGRGHAQLRHPIEYRAFHPCFRALRIEFPSPEPPTDQRLESVHCIFGDT